MTWRERSLEAIEAAAVAWGEERGLALRQLHALPDTDLKLLRKAISDAYPFGERAMHPYKAWLTAVKQWWKFRISHAAPPRVERGPRIENWKTDSEQEPLWPEGRLPAGGEGEALGGLFGESL